MGETFPGNHNVTFTPHHEWKSLLGSAPAAAEQGRQPLRSTVQAALCGGSVPVSVASKEGETQPCNLSDQLCVQERRGGNPLAPSRQLAGALGACDLIKIIVLLHSHMSEGQGELCGASFAFHGICRLQGLKQTPQPFSPIPTCSGLLLQKVVLFFMKYISLF